MKLRSVRLKESLDVRNKVYEMIDELGYKFSEWFNDLYKVENGEVRRLKGMFYNKVEEGISVIDDDKFDMVIDNMKLMLDDLVINGYKINVSKIGKYMHDEYGPNYEKDEDRYIIKISWVN